MYGLSIAIVYGVHGDHSGYGLGQWEEALLCNTSSLWLSPYPEWLLCILLIWTMLFDPTISSKRDYFDRCTAVNEYTLKVIRARYEWTNAYEKFLQLLISMVFWISRGRSLYWIRAMVAIPFRGVAIFFSVLYMCLLSTSMMYLQFGRWLYFIFGNWLLLGNTLRLGKMAAILQNTFSDAFSWIESVVVPISSPNMDQCWLSSLMPIWVTRGSSEYKDAVLPL